MVSSEWGLPPQFENGLVAEDLLSNKYGHKLHFWDLRERRNVQTIDLGANHQMALEIRPAHDPAKEHGFCGVVVDTTNLQGAIFTWWRKDDGTFEAKKTITIDPRPEKAENLPPLLQGFSSRAAAGDRYRPQPGRPVSLCGLLGHWARCTSTTCPTR
jgi:selenium-binding protein 1